MEGSGVKIFGNSLSPVACSAWRFGLLGMVLWLSACASGLVYHRFSFDANSESPDIELVAYQYGNDKGVGMRGQEHEFTIRGVKHFGMGGQAGITGDIIRPDFLFVKWRIKATGEVLEDTVDLKNRLPWDFSRHTVHFTVDGRQLYIYLIGWEKLNPIPCYPSWAEVAKKAKTERPSQKVRSYNCHYPVIQIYP